MYNKSWIAKDVEMLWQQLSFQPFTDPYEAAWAQGVEEKARKMGLKL